MSSKPTSKVHPEMLKMYNSPAYRKKIKKSTESAKMLRGILGQKLPVREKLRASASEKDREDFNKRNKFRLDKECIRYFTHSSEFFFDRRDKKPGGSEK